MSVSKVILVFGLLSFVLHANAQLTGSQLMRDIQYSNSPGKVTIIQNQDIVKVLDKHLYEEGKKKGIQGWRIRLFSNSGPGARKEGELIQAEIISRYPGMRTYFVFDSPWYLLYIGDFRTQSEAMKFLKEEIDKIYPERGYTVNTTINYPKY